MGGAAGGVGPALAQPGHQHVSGAGGDGQQRVVDPLAGIAVVAGALLGQSVGLADGGVQVNGQGPGAGSRPGLPSPGQQLAAHPVELTDVAPPEAAQDLGLPELVRQRLDLGDAPGRANTSDKMMTLVASALAGCDCIDDADVLRTGGTACTLGGTVKAPSTLGTFSQPRVALLAPHRIGRAEPCCSATPRRVGPVLAFLSAPGCRCEHTGFDKCAPVQRWREIGTNRPSLAASIQVGPADALRPGITGGRSYPAVSLDSGLQNS